MQDTDPSALTRTRHRLVPSCILLLHPAETLLHPAETRLSRAAGASPVGERERRSNNSSPRPLYPPGRNLEPPPPASAAAAASRIDRPPPPRRSLTGDNGCERSHSAPVNAPRLARRQSSDRYERSAGPPSAASHTRGSAAHDPAPPPLPELSQVGAARGAEGGTARPRHVHGTSTARPQVALLENPLDRPLQAIVVTDCGTGLVAGAHSAEIHPRSSRAMSVAALDGLRGEKRERERWREEGGCEQAGSTGTSTCGHGARLPLAEEASAPRCSRPSSGRGSLPSRPAAARSTRWRCLARRWRVGARTGRSLSSGCTRTRAYSCSTRCCGCSTCRS